jgi:hypothetical protein
MQYESKQNKVLDPRIVWAVRPGSRPVTHPGIDRRLSYLLCDYLKWIVLKISVLAGFSGTEAGATRMEASNGTLVGGRQA